MEWNYQEYKLEGAAAEVIDCVWQEDYFNKADEALKEQCIFPDHSIELIFSELNFQRTLPFQSKSIQVKSHLSGLKTMSQMVKVESSPLLGIRIKPEALYLLMEETPACIIDNSADAQLVLKGNINSLEDQLFSTSSITEKLELISNYFGNIAKSSISKRDFFFEDLVKVVINSGGNCSISDMAENMNVSVKTIERKFKSKLGIGPKKYARLVRMVNTLKQSRESISLTELAYDNQYYDQMHFVKEVKNFTGLTPAKFFQTHKGIQSPTFG